MAYAVPLAASLELTTKRTLHQRVIEARHEPHREKPRVHLGVDAQPAPRLRQHERLVLVDGDSDRRERREIGRVEGEQPVSVHLGRAARAQQPVVEENRDLRVR